jgi:hypothetical protein
MCSLRSGRRLASSPEAIYQSLRRRREDRQCKADGAGALIVFECFGAIELFAHIVGHLFV